MNGMLKIAMVAGEISGDILGANLMRTLKSRVPNAHFFGVAGPLMQKEGFESWYKMEEIASIGIVEVLSRLHYLIRIRNEISTRLIKLKPDVFIGIDAPDFNLFLEKNLKKKGIKTIHYVSPSIWAWRWKRIFKIRKSADMVLAFFPFEKVLYEKFKVPCRFIGHSIADCIPLHPDQAAARSALGIFHEDCCLALLPGSRREELKMLGAIFLKTAKILYRIRPNLKIIVPLVNEKLCEQFKNIKDKVAPNLPIILLDGKSREAMIASNAALLASGTATLECMMAKCPMIVGYRMNPLTFWIGKCLIKTRYVSLPNILAGHELVKEFLQKKCHPNNLAKALLPLLNNRSIDYEMYKIFLKLHNQIRCNADEQAAEAVLELIKL